LFEESHDKDLYSFNYNELKDMLVGLQCTTPKAIDHAKSVVSQYLKWASKESYSNSYIDITKLIARNDIYNSVSNYSVSEQYIFSREELYSIANMCVNAQDAILFILPYEGVRGKQLEEIRNLKVSDVDEKTCSLTLGTEERRSKDVKKRQIKIAKESIKIILDSIEEEVYYKKNGEIDTGVTAPIYEIIPTDYVVRYTGKRNNSKNIVDAQIINKRITKMAELIEKPELTPTSLFYSGLLNYCKIIEDEKGSLTNEDFKEANIRYGLNPKRFWDTKDLYEFLKDKLR
jgi:integrase